MSGDTSLWQGAKHLTAKQNLHLMVFSANGCFIFLLDYFKKNIFASPSKHCAPFSIHTSNPVTCKCKVFSWCFYNLPLYGYIWNKHTSWEDQNLFAMFGRFFQSLDVSIISFSTVLPNVSDNDNTVPCLHRRKTSGMLKIKEGSGQGFKIKRLVCKIVLDVAEAAWPQNRTRLALVHIKDSAGNLPAVSAGFWR